MRLRTGLPLAAVGTVASVLALVSPASAETSGTLFTGAARGLTAEVAIQGAIEDAVISASGEQLFTCAPVGQPRVFETFTDPIFGHVFFAEADVFCTA